MTISIRPPVSGADYAAMNRLQAEIWGNPVGVVPTHMLLIFAKEGGVVLLMLDDETPIGFTYGFPALTAERHLKLASHEAGVLPAYRDHGLGFQLKLAQREAALAKGFELITWTYDPLQSRNARLNLTKLGGVCHYYTRDLYGDMDDALNYGLPSDRFRIDWWLESPHVVQRLAGLSAPGDGGPILNPVVEVAGLPHPSAEFLPLTGAPFYRVEIPGDIAALKQVSLETALAWRLQTRPF
jgi:predicted GNAT superfamily acetyltransferase